MPNFDKHSQFVILLAKPQTLSIVFDPEKYRNSKLSSLALKSQQLRPFLML
jgi:hypothetical protein